MTNNTRTPLIALVALSAALAMPLAFAQEKTEDAAQAQQTEQATGSATTPTQSTEAAAGTQAKQGWAEVDVDGDGNISKQEAASNPGLSQVFDQADANADGSLTADEYKAFVSKNYGDQQK